MIILSVQVLSLVLNLDLVLKKIIKIKMKIFGELLWVREDMRKDNF